MCVLDNWNSINIKHITTPTYHFLSPPTLAQTHTLPLFCSSHKQAYFLPVSVLPHSQAHTSTHSFGLIFCPLHVSDQHSPWSHVEKRWAYSPLYCSCAADHILRQHEKSKFQAFVEESNFIIWSISELKSTIFAILLYCPDESWLVDAGRWWPLQPKPQNNK